MKESKETKRKLKREERNQDSERNRNALNTERETNSRKEEKKDFCIDKQEEIR